MLTLRSSPASPFGRMVKLSAAILGLQDDIEFQLADTNDVADTLRAQNPLGKIPVLITEDGLALYDSRVIVEYLNHRAGGDKIIPAGNGRFEALVMQSLGVGIMDACLLQVYEKRFRAEDMQLESWLSYQADKVARGMDALAANPPVLNSVDDIHIGHITIACSLGYQDLRFEGAWRDKWPAMVTWLDAFRAAVPAYDETTVKPG